MYPHAGSTDCRSPDSPTLGRNCPLRLSLQPVNLGHCEPNLDGTTNLVALWAFQHGEFLRNLERGQLDVLVFRTYYVPWLDAAYPTRRTIFAPEPGELEGTIVSYRVLAGATGVALPRQ